MATIGIGGDGAKQIALAAPRPQIERILGEPDGRPNAIEEYEQAQGAGAKQARPARHAGQILLRGPVFPDITFFARRATGKLASLHVDEQPRPRVAQDDEIETFDR